MNMNAVFNVAVNTMSSALHVTDRILKLCNQHNYKHTMVGYMCMTYLAYAWYLTVHNKRLFDDSIHRWNFGVVIPNIYHSMKIFNSCIVNIEQLIIESELVYFDEDQIDVIQFVVKSYGRWSASSLHNITKDEAFLKTKVHDILLNEDIKECYLKLYKKYDSSI